MKKDSLAYLYAVLLLVTSLAFLVALSDIAIAQDGGIILEGTDFNQTSTIHYPQDIPTVDIARIVIEYADFATTSDVHALDNLPSPPISRIIVEYADTSLQFGVQPPQNLVPIVTSRIVIEYADYARIFNLSPYLGPQPMGVNDTRPPEIGILSRIPTDPEVPAYQDVTIVADVTDADGGVKNATLQYNINDGTEWFVVPMTLNMSDYSNSLSVSYFGIIPGQPNCTWVNFRVIAYDYAWNTASRDGDFPYAPYHVVPEFPSFLILPLFVTATLLAAIVLKKRKHTTT